AEDHFAGIISIINSKAGGGSGLVSAVGDLQTAHVDLIAFCLACKFQGNGSNLSSSILGQIHIHSGPVTGGFGTGDVQLLGGFGSVLEDQAQLHGNCVIRGLLESNGSLGVFVDSQIGLVQMQAVGTGDITVHYQR